MQIKRLLIKLYVIALFFTLSGCATQFKSYPPKSESQSQPYVNNSTLANYFEAINNPTASKDGFYPLSNNRASLLARLLLIELSTVSLDLQYYIFNNDETGQLISWRLFEAAERGVKVRLLLDDFPAKNEQLLYALAKHPNVEVRLFNPTQYRNPKWLSYIFDFKTANQRMHNKLITADGVTSILGGRNIGNEYFSFGPSVAFGDFDLMVFGDVVDKAGTAFDVYWNSDLATPIEWIVKESIRYSDSLSQKVFNQQQLINAFTSERYNFKASTLYKALVNDELSLFWGNASLYYDEPNKVIHNESQLVTDVRDILSSANESVIIISPYFVPTQHGTEALISAIERGIEVTVVTNSLASNDVFAVHGWYAKYREALLYGDVELWETKATNNDESNDNWSLTGSSKSSLHAKIIIVDDNRFFTGSINMDPRSGNLNTEMGILFEQNEYVGKTIEQLPIYLAQNAYKLELNNDEIQWIDLASGKNFSSEPEASLSQRLGAWLSGILPVEKLL